MCHYSLNQNHEVGSGCSAGEPAVDAPSKDMIDLCVWKEKLMLCD